MTYKLVFTKQAQKDIDKIVKNGLLKNKALEILSILENNPYEPPYEKLLNQQSTYSRRLNTQHRLVYTVYETEKTIKIIRMWTHYEEN